MIIEREIRTFSTTIRAASANGRRTVKGIAARFGSISSLLGDGFYEIIAPGCFTNALQRGDEVIFNQGHDQDRIMARTGNGSLRLRQSDQGLEFEADLPNTTQANDFAESVRTGIINSCSFAFKCDKDEFFTPEQARQKFGNVYGSRNMPLRLLEDLTLYDCCGCSTPAYPVGTAIQANSISQHALAEARARGGRALGDDSFQRELRKRAEALGRKIRQDDAAAAGNPYSEDAADVRRMVWEIQERQK